LAINEPRENVTPDKPIPRPADTGDANRVNINKMDNREKILFFIWLLSLP
jgi:hypothetical protein